MILLLTNDDGLDAPGLAALEESLAEFPNRLVLAPDRHLSGCSHRATTDRQLLLTTFAENRHHLDGTPADCTRVAIAHLCPEIQWVMSGINDGGNLGADVYLSGTVAAVREGALLGRPGIGFSQYRRRGTKVNWARSAAYARRTLHLLLEKSQSAGDYWNVNLPDVQDESPEIVFCPLDPHPMPVKYELLEGKLHYRGNYHERAREPGCDVDVCFSGRIAVTKMSVRQAALI